MSIKAHSVIVRKVSDEVASAVDSTFRDGKLISATAVAQRILENNPDCSMTADELAGWIGRVAATKGVAVEFGPSGDAMKPEPPLPLADAGLPGTGSTPTWRK